MHLWKRSILRYTFIAILLGGVAQSQETGPVVKGRVYLTKQIATESKSFWRVANNKAVSGKFISIGGQKYDKGLGVHAPSNMTYRLDGNFETFHVTPGPDDGHQGLLQMKIILDGKEVFDSGKVSKNNFTKNSLNLPVKDVKELRLLVTDGGDSNGGDHASWGDAYLTGGGKVLISKEVAQKHLPKAVQAQRPGEWWMSRHEEKVAEAAKGNIDLVLIGDSITHYWERDRQYKPFFGEYKTLNLGFGGDRTQHVLWRIQNGEIDGISPKLVSIMLGTNNSSRDKPDDVFLGLKAIVCKLRKRLPNTKILLFSIFPRRQPKNHKDNQQVNKQLPSLVDNKYVFHADINDLFYNEDKTLNMKLLCHDGLHLNDKGYKVWVEAIEPYIKRFLGNQLTK